jgi:hypothetical protein
MLKGAQPQITSLAELALPLAASLELGHDSRPVAPTATSNLFPFAHARRVAPFALSEQRGPAERLRLNGYVAATPSRQQRVSSASLDRPHSLR